MIILIIIVLFRRVSWWSVAIRPTFSPENLILEKAKASCARCRVWHSYLFIYIYIYIYIHTHRERER